MIYHLDSENLSKKVFWLCILRWFAVVGIVIATLITKFFLDLNINFFVLFLIAGLLFLSNIIYILFLRPFLSEGDQKSILTVQKNINFQIFFDFIFLTLLLHFSGGIENPFIIFYIFHMIISSILLSRKWTYIHSTIGIFLFASLAVSEYLGIMPHYSINKYLSSLIENDPYYLFSALVIFIITAYLVVYITTFLAGRLRIVEQKLKAANSDLTEKDKIKNEYVIRVTHDIKGHIAAIKSNLEVVNKQLIAPVDIQNLKFIDKAYNRTQKLNEFIYDLLTLTNMRLNNKFDKEPIDILKVLTSVAKSNKPFAVAKHITFTKEFDITTPFFSGIESSIEEVISNLVQNAIKYTPENGSVMLKASSDIHEFIVTVSDTGYGIPEADIPFIFDEFFRASNIKSAIKDGTGLGLSLVKAIVDRHKGTIHAESEVGVGSKFVVRFPHGID